MESIHNLFDLSGKVALVTGSTQGIGFALAKALGAAGAKVMVNGRNSIEKVEKAVYGLKAQGIDARGYRFDVRSPEEVNKALDEIRNDSGPVDILINNAGVIKRAPLIDMDTEDFREIIDVDLVGPFIMARAVATDMIKHGGGKIINICSLMSELGRDGVGAYAAAKGGLKMLTRNMATEWAQYNIQINAIAPGYIETPLTESPGS